MNITEKDVGRKVITRGGEEGQIIEYIKCTKFPVRVCLKRVGFYAVYTPDGAFLPFDSPHINDLVGFVEDEGEQGGKGHELFYLERAVTRDGREVPMSKANDWVRLFRVAPYGQVVVMLTRDEDRNSVIKFIYKDTKDREHSYELSFNIFDIYGESEGKEFLQKALSTLSNDDVREVLDTLSTLMREKGRPLKRRL